MSVDAEAIARQVVLTLRDAGHVAYFAGGCVRDRLLGLEPKDYDIATDAPPARVQALFRNTQSVGAAFGVILVRLGGWQIEVATFRSDGRYDDGRRPESVTFSTAEADAERRDFSINGLFYDPDADRVIDYVGGQADLASRTLRAIGDPAARFGEDHLRLLRAVRFAARFGLSIEPATAAAIEAHAKELPRISAERIADELRRILTAPTRDIGFRLLWRHGLLRELLATLTNRSAATLDEARSLLLRLAPGEAIAFPVAWLATLIDVRWQSGGGRHDLLGNLTPADAGQLVRLTRTLLRPSNDEAEAITDIARWTHDVLNRPTPDDARLKRLLARPTAAQTRQLLDALAATGVAVDRIAGLRSRFATLSQGDVAPLPLVTGDDLVRAGHRPGPAFKRALTEAYDAQLNGELSDSTAALAFAETLLGKP